MDSWNDMDIGDADLQRLLDEPFTETTEQNRNGLDVSCPGFDVSQGQTWIYPSNLPCRAYQQSITQAALYKNTLVVLPTGLGKTFIAAVVMYNIYRWYPEGKVIFMAPTRPLVAQQIAACKRTMPLPTKDTVELTGKLPRHKRFEYWRSKRVFFATPQSVQSDLIGDDHDTINKFPFHQIKLLVIDEAHKAKGRFAYTEVVQSIWRRNRNFRVLALSATPGRTVDDVAEVVRNLFISHIEIRWDHSVDVMPYVHQRKIKTVVVPLGEAIKKVYAELIQIIDPYERQLIESGVISGSCQNISRNFLLFEQKRFRERSMHQSHVDQSTVNSNFSICISLYHALELLERHGLRIFVNYFEQDEDGRTKFIYNMDIKLRNLIDKLRCELGPNPFDTSINAMTNGQIAKMPKDLDFGHPKFEHARKCLVEHFEKQPDSRAIVFCEYRESVLLVYRLLLQHVPILKPRCFAGQGGTGSLRALTQKQQIQIMQDFRDGKSNVLVATSIAEEGIDVGEVELIVCFDISSANPTRFVQRIGRTGRQKKGNVVMLVTEGREQRLLRDVQANKDQTNKKILRSSIIQAALYKEAPRLVPKALSPNCVKQFVESLEQRDKDEEDDDTKKNSNKATTLKKRRKKEQILEKGTQDLRKFFNNNKDNNNVKKNKNKSAQMIELDEDEMEIFEVLLPGQETQKQLENSFKERFEELDLTDLVIKTNTQLLNSDYAKYPDRSKEPNLVIDSHTPNDLTIQQQSGQCHKELNLVNINTETNIELLSSGPSQTRESKHLRKVNKILQNRAPLVTDSKKKCDILSIIKSKQMTDRGKLLYLKTNRHFVKDIYEKMCVLQVVDVEINKNAVPKEEQHIHECYKHLLTIFGDQAALKQYLNDTKEIKDMKNIGKDYLFDTQDFKECMADIFHGLNDNLFTRDNNEFIHKEFKKTMQYQRAVQRKTNEIDEGSMAEEVDAIGYEEDLETSLNLEDISEMNLRYNTYFEKQLEMKIDEETTESVLKPMEDNVDIDEHSLAEEIYAIDAVEEMESEMNSRVNMYFEKQLEIKHDAEKTESVLQPIDDHMNTQIILEDNFNDLENKSIDSCDMGLVLSSEYANERKNTSLINCYTNNSFKEVGPFEEFSKLVRRSLAISTPINMKHKPKNCKQNNLENLKECDEEEPETNTIVSKSYEQIDLTEIPLDDDATPDELPELYFSAHPKSKKAEKEAKKCAKEQDDLQTQLDVDLDVFMEPFPEEENFFTAKSTTSTATTNNVELKRDSQKENIVCSSLLERNSPDLFDTSDKKELLPFNKLSIKSLNKPAEVIEVKKSPVHSSPIKFSTSSSNIKKSPSVFESYWQRVQLNKLKKMNSVLNANKLSQINSVSQSTPRKIIDSPVRSKKKENKNIIPNSFDSDFEEIAPSQEEQCSSVLQKRKKRRLCNFIDDEVEISGNEHSSDEAEETIGHYMLDSVVVHDDQAESEQSAASRSHMQAMYLQSLKSPRHRPGGFKIPHYNTFNDHADIFSQTVDVGPSQYIPDSFVVEEGSQSIIDVSDDEVSICPLERAEMILKQRRKERKLQATKQNPSKNTKKRRVYRISDSSDE